MAEVIEGGFTVPMPRMVRVRQIFPREENSVDVLAAMEAMFSGPGFKRLAPGSRIAVAVGSRGIVDVDKIVGGCIRGLIGLGFDPFIVPAMGSHGGATAEGQIQILKGHGITPETMGVPIRSSMEVDKIGELEDGLPVYMDRQALRSDGLIVINRIKPHTGFRGDYESGLLKMLTIGLGKHLGATTYHNYGLDAYSRALPRLGGIVMNATPFIGGIAVTENSYHQIVDLRFVRKDELLDREKQLLLRAKKLMPRIMFDPVNVLIVNDFGKEISGPGMDPNITGRPVSPYVEIDDAPAIDKIAVLNLTPASEGNAVGIGAADVTTKRFVDSMDLGSTYANSIASTFLNSAKIPVYMNNDFEAIQVALKTCTGVRHPHSRIIWIKDTLHLDEIYVSEIFLPEVQNNPNLVRLGDPEPMRFDGNGNLTYS